MENISYNDQNDYLFISLDYVNCGRATLSDNVVMNECFNVYGVTATLYWYQIMLINVIMLDLMTTEHYQIMS